ncbi:MAG: lysophospholipid acyltransferase family protein [Vulcanimicrobiota bacterium]
MSKDFFYTGKALLLLFYRNCCNIEYSGLENVPEKGGFILASNHVSNYDPFAVGIGIDHKVCYLAKQELFEGKNKLFIGPLLRGVAAIPIKRSTVDRKALNRATEILKEGHVLGIFPEGGRSRDGQVKDEGKNGAAMFSVMLNAPILPAAITGTINCLISKFPPRWKKITVKYGKPIYPSEFEHISGKKQRMNAITQRLLDDIKQIQKELE